MPLVTRVKPNHALITTLQLASEAKCWASKRR